MPVRQHRPTSVPSASSNSGGVRAAEPTGAAVSNSQRQEQLREKSAVRGDPAPWAAQGRAVRFQSEPSGQLFRGGATDTDVVQGRNGSRYLGDCWLMASVASIARSQPGLLERAITDHGDGTYTVRLHRQEPDGRMSVDDVTVDGDLPRTADGRDAYAQRQDPKELWVVVVEKAFAAWKGGYGALDGGVPSDALTALTGRPSGTAFTRGADPGALGQTLREQHGASRPMVAASGTNFSLGATGIVPGHGHSVVDVSEEGGQTWVTVRDPFAAYEPKGNGARDGVFRIPLAEFQARFQYVTWAETDRSGGDQAR